MYDSPETYRKHIKICHSVGDKPSFVVCRFWLLECQLDIWLNITVKYCHWPWRKIIIENPSFKLVTMTWHCPDCNEYRVVILALDQLDHYVWWCHANLVTFAFSVYVFLSLPYLKCSRRKTNLALQHKLKLLVGGIVNVDVTNSWWSWIKSTNNICCAKCKCISNCQ